MELHLQGQKALVSASSGGIGLAIATAFAREGVEVIINGRSEDSVNSAIAKIKDSLSNAKLLSFVADLRTSEGLERSIV